MLNGFFQGLSIPVLLIISIMAYMGLSEVLLSYITEKRYIIAGIIAIIATGIFGFTFAFIETIIVMGRLLYRKYKQKIIQKKNL